MAIQFRLQHAHYAGCILIPFDSRATVGTQVSSSTSARSIDDILSFRQEEWNHAALRQLFSWVQSDISKYVSGSCGLYEEVLFPGVARDNWQMLECERIALTGVLARLRPRGALEIGVYHGGSFSLAAQFSTRIIGIDNDPAVRTRFTLPHNAELLIGHSEKMIPRALATFAKAGLPLQYVLIDAEHSAEGVRRDINLVLKYRPMMPMVMLIHDSGNAGCRAGVLSADWNSNTHVHAVQCDFVPGQIVEHSIRDGRAQVWGGLALAYLDPSPRSGELVPRQGSATMIRAAQLVADDLDVLKGRSTVAD